MKGNPDWAGWGRGRIMERSLPPDLVRVPGNAASDRSGC